MHMDFGGAQTKVSINNQRTTSHAGLGNKYTRHTRKRATAVWFCWMKLQAKYHLSGNRSAFSWDSYPWGSNKDIHYTTFYTCAFISFVHQLGCPCKYIQYTAFYTQTRTSGTNKSCVSYSAHTSNSCLCMCMDFECVKTGVTKLGHTSQCLFHICTYVKPLTGIC